MTTVVVTKRKNQRGIGLDTHAADKYRAHYPQLSTYRLLPSLTFGLANRDAVKTEHCISIKLYRSFVAGGSRSSDARYMSIG